jgi:hypothetical protein
MSNIYDAAVNLLLLSNGTPNVTAPVGCTPNPCRPSSPIPPGRSASRPTSTSRPSDARAATTILSRLITSESDLRALARELDVPALAGLQHQGDLSVIPARMAGGFRPAETAVPPAGVPVLRGVPGGNTHLLLAANHALLSPRADA